MSATGMGAPREAAGSVTNHTGFNRDFHFPL
jgi:hypothetical protein